MESFGFDRDDFRHLLDSVEDINGVNRVGASSVAGTPLLGLYPSEEVKGACILSSVL